MKPAVLEPPPAQEPEATFNTRADAVEALYWRPASISPVTFVTVAVRFQEDSDSDVLASRLVEQEVLDLLDDPAPR
jgi:hypothetical protein